MQKKVITRNGKPTLVRTVFEWVKANPGYTTNQIAEKMASERHSIPSIKSTVSAMVRGKVLSKDGKSKKIVCAQDTYAPTVKAKRAAHKKLTVWQRFLKWMKG